MPLLGEQTGKMGWMQVIFMLESFKKKSYFPDSLAASTLDLTAATVRGTFMAFGWQQGAGAWDSGASPSSASKHCPEEAGFHCQNFLTLVVSWLWRDPVIFGTSHFTTLWFLIGFWAIKTIL